ncbi:MAG TPA: nucleoside-diphosphate sugar epimerase/dehydratase, partial [Reyranella sp.]|nr:nucleoside-diphosphate sugar epimerase/dehydratase [Reyranella sp.]
MAGVATAILPRLAVALRTYALSRTRPTKRWIAMLVDACLCAITCYASVILRLGFFPERDTPFGLLVAVSIGVAIPIFHALGLYREIFSQSGLPAILSIARACAIYTLPFATIFTVVSVFGIPRTIVLIQPILLFVSISASRILARYWLFDREAATRASPRRVLIYGAGSAGRQLAGAILQSAEMTLLGYLDDNPALAGNRLNGLRIYPAGQLPAAVQRLAVDEILLAIPSASRQRRNAIIKQALGAGAKIRTLPRLMDIADGRVEATQLRDIEIEDLLGRASVVPDRELMHGNIRGRTVMVTGAGGSIGGELCRLITSMDPAVLLLVEISEFGLYEIHRQLTREDDSRWNTARIVPLLGSVSDAARMEEIISTWRPDVIYHAAAYKHVPLVEINPAEGVRTNVLGTYTLASTAARHAVADFILVSTDKAVRPTSVMGATKRVAELILQAFDEVSPDTCFSMVRFGNVLGSSGSVVPLFREQIRSGGPVTLTDRRITRYFMTISEAAELVLQAGAMARGGDVFVLDMGKPVRIADLARNMIELAGLSVRSNDNPAGDVEIVEIGLRPGEKLYEELLIGNDLSPTAHPRIMRSSEDHISMMALRGLL